MILVTEETLEDEHIGERTTGSSFKLDLEYDFGAESYEIHLSPADTSDTVRGKLSESWGG